jgi:hypothetical protein
VPAEACVKGRDCVPPHASAVAVAAPRLERPSHIFDAAAGGDYCSCCRILNRRTGSVRDLFSAALPDYQNDMARMYIYTELSYSPILQRYYEPHWQILPDLPMDLVVPARIMPVESDILPSRRSPFACWSPVALP